ncbi:MAG: methylated-DNA--[protein]-cysteine S-methyltransferase [Bacillota bacterium]
MNYAIADTALGFIGIAATERGLYRVTLPQSSSERAWEQLQDLNHQPLVHDPESLSEVVQRFIAYAQGQTELSDLPLDYEGLTPFQRQVSELVHDIPMGATENYGSIAARCGCPHGARAVGGVMASNRLCLVVPCHRVVASDGTLNGFGGGLPQKAQLLRLEGLEIDEEAGTGRRKYRIIGRK